MKNVILLVLAGFAGWYGYSRYQQRSHASIAAPAPPRGGASNTDGGSLARRSFQVRWSHLLLADDLVRGGDAAQA